MWGGAPERPPRVWRRRAAPPARWSSGLSARVELRCFTWSRGGPDDRGEIGIGRALEKAGDGDFLRVVAEAVLQLLMEADVEGLIGAARHERSPERLNYRNGYRDRTLDTRLVSLQLRVPKLRQGIVLPGVPGSTAALLTGGLPRRPGGSDPEAWIGGVSTRRADDLVQAPPGSGPAASQPACPLLRAMGLSGIESQVSKLCKDIDERVNTFLDRPLEGEWPYLWLDATYLKQREGGRIVSVAAIIALAVNRTAARDPRSGFAGGGQASGSRSVPRRPRRFGPASQDPGPARPAWRLLARHCGSDRWPSGIDGRELVISDAHDGLKQAVGRSPRGHLARCRVPSAIC